MKHKISFFSLDFLTIFLNVNFLIMIKKEYLTEKLFFFIILAKHLNERLCKHCQFPNEHVFPGLEEMGGGGDVGGGLAHLSQGTH